MKKIEIKVTVFDEHGNEPIPFKKIKDIIQDDDIIVSGYQEPEYYGDSSHEGYHYLVVYRWRFETDEEAEKRIIKNRGYQEELKGRRYETYLKLKKEFESE
jgi:hypothetical protein